MWEVVLFVCAAASGDVCTQFEERQLALCMDFAHCERAAAEIMTRNPEYAPLLVRPVKEEK